MSKTIYIPRQGSMPTLLLQHLQAHPDVKFTSAEIAARYDRRATAIQTALAPAVAVGQLSRTLNGGPRGAYHYGAGPKLAAFDLAPQPKAKPAATAAAPAHADPLCSYGDYCASTDTVTLNARQREYLNMVIGGFALAAAAAAHTAQAEVTAA